MDGTNVADWSILVTFLSSPISIIALTFFVWKMTGEMKELKAAQKELTDTIHNNGFLKKEDLEEAWKRGDEVHKRHDEAITELRKDVDWLRAR